MCLPRPQWLLANGASFPKIRWPARATVGGVRGTVAQEDIEARAPHDIVLHDASRYCLFPPLPLQTNEHMLIIPEALMITPPLVRAFPPLKDLFDTLDFFKSNDDVVRPPSSPCVFVCVFVVSTCMCVSTMCPRLLSPPPTPPPLPREVPCQCG